MRSLPSDLPDRKLSTGKDLGFTRSIVAMHRAQGIYDSSEPGRKTQSFLYEPFPLVAVRAVC